MIIGHLPSLFNMFFFLRKSQENPPDSTANFSIIFLSLYRRRKKIGTMRVKEDSEGFNSEKT